MQTELDSKLEKLRADYDQIVGKPFTHFYCPIIRKDENVQLCKAHIVNRAFPNSPRAWTVQRNDIDGFYGSNFESDFVAIKYRENHSLSDKILSKIFNTEILVDEEPIEYFVAKKEVPQQFTAVEFEINGQIIRLGIKIPPEEFLSIVDHKWEIATSKDVRIPAMVSLIKSAHLSLFEILGYQYALSLGGYFVGRQILGEFFLQNLDKQKSEVLKNAKPYFQEFTHMVRPVLSFDADIQGTITDRIMFICKGSNGLPWAFIVFIKISESMHGVLIPIFDNPESVEMFMSFLNNKNESLDVLLTQFNQNRWEINNEVSNLHWPKSGVLYPE